ncbi:Apc13p protein-domain-containing protein [Lineolata rhizophorae]|uniref:Apc13p protein-domain-containing protein n=1 Tax=Lineolata rhizophorae TaxID=578093 RepID=A0A6A6NPL9_9PEZI|nr:Apc13p protein-domain-containing protein [Lineolata rhizophorae]
MPSPDTHHTYLHHHRSSHADLLEDFTRSALRAPNQADDDIFVPPHLLPPNPEDEDDVVPDMHAAFGIQRATARAREPAWRDLGVDELVRPAGAGAAGAAGGVAGANGAGAGPRDPLAGGSASAGAGESTAAAGAGTGGGAIVGGSGVMLQRMGSDRGEGADSYRGAAVVTRLRATAAASARRQGGRTWPR